MTRLLLACAGLLILSPLVLHALDSSPPSVDTTDPNNPPVPPIDPPHEDCPCTAVASNCSTQADLASVVFKLNIGTSTYETRNNFVDSDWSKRAPVFKGYNPPSMDRAPFASSLFSEWGKGLVRPVQIALVSEEITETLSTPAALQLYGGTAGTAWVKKDESGTLRQILTDQYLTDISGTGGVITISIYPRKSIGDLSPDGVYPLPVSENLFRTVVISRSGIECP